MVALPFSSFQLNPSLAEYLRLTDSQIRSIEKVMMQEKRDVEPLVAELRTTREKLLAFGPGQSEEKNIKALAENQAGLLAKLVVSNARMQSKIYELLNPEQRRRLDLLKSSKLSTTGK